MRLTTVQSFTQNCSRVFFSLLLVSGVALSGCSTKGAGTDADLTGEGTLSESDLTAQREGRFGSGGIPSAEGSGLFGDVPFGYDSYAIDGAARQVLERNAQTLQDRPELKVTLEGHCDERGTVEYNMALGAERARAVKNELMALGISSSRLDTISYGEEVPLDPGHDESAWEQNRRVHFSASGIAPSRQAQ